jgi:hypothetical protein
VTPLVALRPELVGVMFGRSPRRLPAFTRVGGRVRFVALGIAVGLFVVTLASIQGALTAPGGTPSAIGVLAEPRRAVDAVALPLSQDPVALLVIAVAILTPVFCAAQIDAIRDYVPTNERNLGRRARLLYRNRIDRLVAVTNNRFARLGGRFATAGFLIVSVAGSCALYAGLVQYGLFSSWNATRMPNDTWSAKVYDGWWANGDHHPALAVALIAIGAYLFYFLAKQLVLGFIFAGFARRAARLGFRTTPELTMNVDGFWGLRPLRRLMQWTYASTLAHFLATLGVFVVWLPFSQWTMLLAIGVMTANSAFVFSPSALAHRSVLAAKTVYINELVVDARLGGEQKYELADRVWQIPNLPFRARSTLTAATVYFLVPLCLAFVSAQLT